MSKDPHTREQQLNKLQSFVKAVKDAPSILPWSVIKLPVVNNFFENMTEFANEVELIIQELKDEQKLKNNRSGRPFGRFRKRG